MNKKSDTIQNTCGFKEPTERHYMDLGDDVDKAFRNSFLKRGLAVPRISRYHITPANSDVDPRGGETLQACI